MSVILNMLTINTDAKALKNSKVPQLAFRLVQSAQGEEVPAT